MAVPDTTNKTAPPKKKEYEYGRIKLSLDNCILPSEMLDETPSMKDGLDRDIENDLRRWGCELIQVSGLLLKLPQTAMATGQVILQRFYYIKSVINHDVETCAMACVFLAAKIEECPRRLRDVINVWDYVKQKKLKRNEIPVPMDYYGTQYATIKNNVIKSERRILKELGFCVHVKHPHKIIITYLQMLEHQTNAALARSAWNFMNDSLRTDVFVRFSPDIIACACIFLAARTVKVNLPLRPPWWLLFDASFEDIEDICLSILRLYSLKPVSISQIDGAVKKLKDKKKKDPSDKGTPNASTDSFTPTHTSTNPVPLHAQVNNTKENSSKPSSKSSSPVEKEMDNHTKRTSIDYKKMKADSDKAFVREQDVNSRNQIKDSNLEPENDRGHLRTSSDDTSESETELPSKKYEKQREQYETKKRSHPVSGSGSDTERNSRTSKPEISKDREKHTKLKDSNGKYNEKHDAAKLKRSRSRSPEKRSRSSSPKRKMKNQNHRTKEKNASKVRHFDKYANSWR